MTDSATTEQSIADSEPIARVLFSPSMVDGERVSPTAFEMVQLANGPESYVSLYLTSIFAPTRENCAHLKARKEGDSLFGYATSIVSKCKALTYDSISVFFKRHEHTTKGHIGLHYTKSGKSIKGQCHETSFIILTKLIANKFTAFKFDD